MSRNVLPLAIGAQSTSASLASLLGQLYIVESAAGTKKYRLVKAAAALATPYKKIVASAISGGLPTWSCDVTTTASLMPAGVIDRAFGTTTIASGAYYLLQTGGPSEVLSAAAVATMVSIGTSTTAGSADDATITGGGIGFSTEAAAGAAEDMGCFLTLD